MESAAAAYNKTTGFARLRAGGGFIFIVMNGAAAQKTARPEKEGARA